MFSVGLLVLGADVVSSQDFPNKPIRIVTSGVGGGGDFVARQIAQGISAPLGQPVIVENRPTIMAIEAVAKASPDGHTLYYGGSTMWTSPYMQEVSWDPVRDFSPITLISTAPNILVVHPSVPVRSVKELIALAKARPGELNYASGPAGGPAHLAGELFKAMSGVNIVRIAYKGGGPLMIGLIGGEVHLALPSATAAAPHMKSGKLKALAVTSAGPSALAPGLPTVAASGLPGYEAVAITGIFAPAKAPGAIINRLSQEIVWVLNQVDVKEKFFNLGVEAVGSSPEQLAATVKSEMARMGKVIKDAGFKAD